MLQGGRVRHPGIRRAWAGIAGLCGLVAVTMCGIPAGPPSAGAATSLPGTVVPGTQLSGAGAFLGPVRRIPVNGIRIGYRQFGSGPPLIMVTGDTAAMSLWTVDLLGRLSQHFRVTIFDNRGVGYSTDNLRVPLTVPLMADDTADLIAALHLKRPTLLGWSMGGEIGLTVAAQHPGVLSGLVTTGADPGGSQAVQPAPGVIAQVNSPTISPTQLLNYLFPSTAGAAKTAFVQQYELMPQETVSNTTLARQEQAELSWYHYEKTWNALPRISIPVLVTNGAEDVLNPPANAGLIAKRIPGAKKRLFAGAGHGMLFQDSPAFVRSVVQLSR